MERKTVKTLHGKKTLMERKQTVKTLHGKKTNS